MPRKMFGLPITLALILSCAGFLLSHAMAQDQKLTGMAAWNQLVGNSIIGEEDGKTLVKTSILARHSEALGATRRAVGAPRPGSAAKEGPALQKAGQHNNQKNPPGAARQAEQYVGSWCTGHLIPASQFRS